MSARRRCARLLPFLLVLALPSTLAAQTVDGGQQVEKEKQSEERVSAAATAPLSLSAEGGVEEEDGGGTDKYLAGGDEKAFTDEVKMEVMPDGGGKDAIYETAISPTNLNNGTPSTESTENSGTEEKEKEKNSSANAQMGQNNTKNALSGNKSASTADAVTKSQKKLDGTSNVPTAATSATKPPSTAPLSSSSDKGTSGVKVPTTSPTIQRQKVAQKPVTLPRATARQPGVVVSSNNPIVVPDDEDLIDDVEFTNSHFNTPKSPSTLNHPARPSLVPLITAIFSACAILCMCIALVWRATREDISLLMNQGAPGHKKLPPTPTKKSTRDWSGRPLAHCRPNLGKKKATSKTGSH